MLYQKGLTANQRQSARPIHCYNYPSLPSITLKIYEYARKFVYLLRTKTPRIVITTPSLKAFWMDNGLSADMLIKYNDISIRMEYTKDSDLLRILRADQQIFTLTNPLSNINDSHEMKGFLLEFRSRYKEASEVCKRIYSDQNRGVLPFPYVIREGISDSRNLQSAYCQPSIPLMTITDGTALATDFKRPLPTLPTTSSPNSSCNFAFVYKTYLSNVGWCLASTSDEFLLLFMDGITVLINGKTNMVGFHDPQAAFTKWFSIDGTLPPFAKKKLSFFPRFVQLLKSGHGHSFVS